MKRAMILASVVASFLVAGTAGAAEGGQIGKGSAALLFQWKGLSDMTPTSYGGGLGAKYFVLPQLAIRGDLLFAHGSHTIAANPPAGTTGSDGSITGTRMGIGVAAEYHLATGRISPYVGAGLSFATESSSHKTAVTGTQVPITTENDTACESVSGDTYCGGTTLGAAAIVGVEFFPFEHISLGAEYQLGYGSRSRADEKVTEAGQPDQTTKVGGDSGFGLASAGFLTLTVYFL